MRLIDYSLYCLKELLISLKHNRSSHLFTIVSTALAFTVSGFILTAWWAGGEVIEHVKDHGEIMAFPNEELSSEDIGDLQDQIFQLEGVEQVSYIDEEAAAEQMSLILGEDDRILDYYDTSPLANYLQINTTGENISFVMDSVSEFEQIEYLRSNEGILDQIETLSNITGFLGGLFMALVAGMTMVITSHIVRLGLMSRRDEIITLKLLGASNKFISSPFVLEGTLLGILGGALSVVLIQLGMPQIYGMLADALPFMPLPNLMNFTPYLSIGFPLAGALFGCLGSMFTLLNTRN